MRIGRGGGLIVVRQAPATAGREPHPCDPSVTPSTSPSTAAATTGSVARTKSCIAITPPTWNERDALLFGRVTYEMMEEAWRPSPTGAWPDWMADWMLPFARTIDAARKYVVSRTLDQVDWNAELVQGDLATAVEQLKQEPGEGLAVGGVTLPLALADLGLIDEYEFVVQPVVAGHGPTLFAGLRERLDLQLVGRQELQSGAVALRYRPSRAAPAA